MDDAGDIHVRPRVDNAPLTGTYVVGSNDDRVSDPRTSIATRASTPFNQTHTLAVSAVVAPQVSGDGWRARLLKNNQVGDHPAGEQRAAVQHPLERRLEQGRRAQRPAGRHRAQLRPPWPGGESRPAISRFLPIRNTWRGELFFEAKNLFNVRTCPAVNRVVTTDASACPAAALPSTFPGTAGYDQRQMQLGSQVLLLGRWPKVTGGSG